MAPYTVNAAPTAAIMPPPRPTPRAILSLEERPPLLAVLLVGTGGDVVVSGRLEVVDGINDSMLVVAGINKSDTTFNMEEAWVFMDIHRVELRVGPLDSPALVAVLGCTVLSVESLAVPALFAIEASKVVPTKEHPPCAQSMKDCMSGQLSCAQARS